MIRLHRPALPNVLKRKAANATATLRAAWAKGEEPAINQALYGHTEVKAALRTAQHDKCAYCETRDVRSPGAIEHFRPKSGWRQKDEPLQKPGYFWLAYEWENLLFACTLCNDAGHKQNRFPLANPQSRATPAQPDHSAERPLLLNPYETDPEQHITWSAHVPRAHKNSRRGRETIKVFGLDQDRLLIDKRRDYLSSVAFVVQQAEGMNPDSVDRATIRAFLLKHLDDSTEYVAMMRVNLGDRIRAL